MTLAACVAAGLSCAVFTSGDTALSANPALGESVRTSGIESIQSAQFTPSWVWLLGYLEQLEIILRDPAGEQSRPPLLVGDEPEPPQGLEAEQAAQDFVQWYGAEGIRSGLSGSEIATAEGLCAQLVGLLDSDPGLLQYGTEQDLRDAMDEIEIELANQ